MKYTLVPGCFTQQALRQECNLAKEMIVDRDSVLEYLNGNNLPMDFKSMVVTPELIMAAWDEGESEFKDVLKPYGKDAMYTVVVLDPAKPYIASVDLSTPVGELRAFTECILSFWNMGENLPIRRSTIKQALRQAKVSWVFGANSGSIQANRLRHGDATEAGAAYNDGIIVSVAGLTPACNERIAIKFALKIRDNAERKLLALRENGVVIS